MQVCGVICEYNPFHKGHALHLSLARRLSGAEYIVCVMSGPVTQRGVFARHDKWTRAQMALQNGCDLVLELPARFACSGAPDFAAGGVSLLDALGIVSHLSFGCEKESLPYLARTAQIFSEESEAFREALRSALDSGMSYPQARAAAAEKSSGVKNLAGIIAQPNTALALEYLRALPANIAPVPVAREGSGYHDGTLSALSSATAVRAALEAGSRDAAMQAVPSPHLLAQAEENGDLHEEEALTNALLYRLLTMTPEALRGISGVDEGLEFRFLAAARTASSREELISLVKSRRYTHTRLSRILSNVLMDVTREFADMHRAPRYARILGFRRSAQPLLREIKRAASVPLITKTADFDAQDPLFALDLRAQDLWSLGVKNPALRKAGRDFTTSPVVI